MTQATACRVLADGILLLHFGVILFVAGGFVWIWVGHGLGWRAVRSFGMRLTHLLLIGLIAIQALLEQFCPLTVWEARLRAKAGLNGRYASEGFIAYWVGRIIYYDVDLRVFAVIYIVFFAAVIATWFLVRPAPPGCKHHAGSG